MEISNGKLVLRICLGLILIVKILQHSVSCFLARLQSPDHVLVTCNNLLCDLGYISDSLRKCRSEAFVFLLTQITKHCRQWTVVCDH